MMQQEKRGSIAFFTTYRPSVPLDLYSCPVPPSSWRDEILMTDGVSYNYNGHVIPAAALKTILKRPKLATEAKDADIDSGRLSGMFFVSERTGNLETLHIALQFNDKPPQVKVLNFADVFGTFNGVRMEDSGCIAGDYLVYISTKEPAGRRQPWTAVYRTNLKTGKTDRLTPTSSILESVKADLSPSVSPSGKKIAMASFTTKVGGWNGEIENLQTDIIVMNVNKPFNRHRVVKNGGWPTWGSENIIFFHRKVGDCWGVYQADISKGFTSNTPRVTPDGIDAITPAAINATTVAVATVRQKSKFSDIRNVLQYRHIEIFDSRGRYLPLQVTQKSCRPKADHFNPFVIDGGKRIGFHSCTRNIMMMRTSIERQFLKITSPQPDVGLFRVSGVFPTFSKDGSKLAFVDNEFKAVWIVDSKGLRMVYETRGPDNVFSPVWNQNPEKDILYVCMGPSFSARKELNICAIPNVSTRRQHRQQLTKAHNNAFPSTNREGTRLVYRSTRDGHKNLYIMEDARCGEYEEGKITRLTNGPWIDTHCDWSPRGNWIVFSSTRDKPKGAPPTDNNLDPGYFAVYLVNPSNPSLVVRVMGSGNDLAGHVNHPIFSPDGKSIVVTADLAGVSVDPISMPLVEHSVRPYGDIFTIDIDPEDINKNKNVKKFNRITHSRYENGTATWTKFSTQDPKAEWNLQFNRIYYTQHARLYRDGGHSWHLSIPKRCSSLP